MNMRTLRTAVRFRLYQAAHLLTRDPLWRTPYHNIKCAVHDEPTQQRRHPKGGWGHFCRTCDAFADRGVIDRDPGGWWVE